MDGWIVILNDLLGVFHGRADDLFIHFLDSSVGRRIEAGVYEF